MLRISVDLITTPVEDWRSSQSYQQARYLVKSLNIVNDSAERGVKLAHDYIHWANKEDNYQNLLQSVEYDRNLMPNLRKQC